MFLFKTLQQLYCFYHKDPNFHIVNCRPFRFCPCPLSSSRAIFTPLGPRFFSVPFFYLFLPCLPVLDSTTLTRMAFLGPSHQIRTPLSLHKYLDFFFLFIAFTTVVIGCCVIICLIHKARSTRLRLLNVYLVPFSLKIQLYALLNYDLLHFIL